MSRGLGQTQRRILAALQAEPRRRFTVEELAAIVYPGEPVTHSHVVSVRRVVRGLAVNRVRLSQQGSRGWHWLVSAKS